MGSTFSSYGIAVSGMYASQRGLYVTGHNISNVNTPGFSRQQAIIAESTPMNTSKGQIGLGADIQEIRQIRDQFLDVMYRNESESLGYWEAKSKTISDIESILGEPSGTGLQKSMDEFFQSWQEVSKDPSSLTVRAMVRQRGISLVDTINHIGNQLDKLQEDINTEIRLKIDDINQMAEQIATLNVQIMKSEVAGDAANDFRDERNLLLDELSKIVNIDVLERNNGMVYASIGGIYLVNGEEASAMKADYNKPNSLFLTAKWEEADTFVQLSSGSLQGLIESRGDVAGYKGSEENGSPSETTNVDIDASTSAYNFDPSGSKDIIPELRKGLNMMVSLLTRKINEIHRDGIGIDGTTGTDFFTRLDDTVPFEMGNIQVNPELDDLDKLAVSATGAQGDNTIAERIVAFRHEDFFTAKGLTVGVDDFYSSIMSWVGTTGQEAHRIAENQSKLAEQIQSNKESISGVSMDEEMSNMMKYQHAYNASAKVINVIDSMIDTIVSRMGVVGR